MRVKKNSYSFLLPTISFSMVMGDVPAKMKTGILPRLMLCTAAPMPSVPHSTCTNTAAGRPVICAKPLAAERAFISLGLVTTLSPACRPLEKAAMKAGWSEPRFTNMCVTPASSRAMRMASAPVMRRCCFSTSDMFELKKNCSMHEEENEYTYDLGDDK